LTTIERRERRLREKMKWRGKRKKMKELVGGLFCDIRLVAAENGGKSTEQTDDVSTDLLGCLYDQSLIVYFVSFVSSYDLKMGCIHPPCLCCTKPNTTNKTSNRKIILR
jgi:hypothetical protein